MESEDGGVEVRVLLDVVVGQGSAAFQLPAGDGQALLVWWDTLLVLDLGLNTVNGVGKLKLMVFPLKIFTKICIRPRRTRRTRWRVDLF